MFFTFAATDICAINSDFQLIGNIGVNNANINSILEITSNANIFVCTITSVINQFFNQLVDISICRISAVLFTNATIFFEVPHFQLFFGLSATQTATALIINKADLTGLTPSANNTAESLLVGIINRILGGTDLLQFLHIDFKYWGYGIKGEKRIDTVLIFLYDNLYNGTGDIATLTTLVKPNNY